MSDISSEAIALRLSLATTPVDENIPQYVTGSGLDESSRAWLKLRREMRFARNRSKPILCQILHPRYNYKSYWTEALLRSINSETDEGFQHTILSPSFPLQSTKQQNMDMEYNSIKNNPNEPPNKTRSRSDIVLEAVFLRQELTLKEILTTTDLSLQIGPKQRNLLQIVILRNDRPKIDILLHAGIDINYRDKDGFTALMLAVNTPSVFHPLTLLDTLLTHGADVNISDARGRTALHRSVQFFASEPQKEFHYDIMRRLLDAGAHVDTIDNDGRLPLDMVVTKTLRLPVERCFTDSLLLSYNMNKNHQHQHYRKSHHVRMWAKIISRDFVQKVFKTVEKPCAVCRRREEDCMAMKTTRYRYWLFVHNKIPRGS
eukprot:gene11309-23663_t